MLILAGAACLIIFSFGKSESAWWGQDKAAAKVAKPAASGNNQPQAAPVMPAKEEARAVEQPQIDAAKQESLSEKKASIEKKRKALNNTEWSVDLSPISGKGKKETESLTFSNNQISSSAYVKRGFAPTNYTITVQDDGSSVWETMQVSEKSGTAFWRGDLDTNTQNMKGILSVHNVDETVNDYSFVSTAKKTIQPVIPAVVEKK